MPDNMNKMFAHGNNEMFMAVEGCNEHPVRMNVVAQKLKEAASLRGLKDAEVARRAGMSPERYSSYVRGRTEADYTTLTKLCGVLGVDANFLFGMSEQIPPLPSQGALSTGLVEIDGIEYASIRRFDAGLSAGAGSIIDDAPTPLGYQLFENQWLRAITQATPENLALLRVDGDSMEDTFSHGDWLLIDLTVTNPAREGIYALQVDGAAWVKRLSVNKASNTVRIISDNTRWPVQEWPAEAVSVIGRVVWLMGRKVV